MRTAQDILENMEELINEQKKEIASLKEQLINKECNCCGGSDADVNKYIDKLKEQLIRQQEQHKKAMVSIAIELAKE